MMDERDAFDSRYDRWINPPEPAYNQAPACDVDALGDDILAAKIRTIAAASAAAERGAGLVFTTPATGTNEQWTIVDSAITRAVACGLRLPALVIRFVAGDDHGGAAHNVGGAGDVARITFAAGLTSAQLATTALHELAHCADFKSGVYRTLTYEQGESRALTSRQPPARAGHCWYEQYDDATDGIGWTPAGVVARPPTAGATARPTRARRAVAALR